VIYRVILETPLIGLAHEPRDARRENTSTTLLLAGTFSDLFVGNMGEVVKLVGGAEVAFGITVSEEGRCVMKPSLLNDKLVAVVAPGHRRIGQ
jgi:hypothetical protein